MNIQYKGYLVEYHPEPYGSTVTVSSDCDGFYFCGMIDAIQFIDELTEDDGKFRYLEMGYGLIFEQNCYQDRCSGCAYLTVNENGEWFCDCAGKPCEHLKTCV